jgi:hypothetical protein
MAKIQVIEGTYTGNSIDELHLASQHLLHPEYNLDEVIMYTEKRWLSTLLTSGVYDSRYAAPRQIGKGNIKTYVPQVPEGELIDGVAWKYKMMGRIQRATEILNQIGVATAGTTTSGGYFSLAMKDNYLQPGMVAFFYNRGMASVVGSPTGGPGYWVYRFQCFPGDTFNYTTWVDAQGGTKTLFGGYSSYGERSIRGYDVMHYPDMFIQHITLQRKGFDISGQANVRKIFWYQVEGSETKGFVYEQEQQSRARLNRENEIQKWYGRSTMKSSTGALLATPSRVDEKGHPIWAGDGVIPQIDGSNNVTASGTDGMPVYADFTDLMTILKKKADNSEGNLWVCKTGSEGKQHVADMLYIMFGASVRVNVEKASGENGGQYIEFGYNFDKFNFGGNTLVFVEDPLQDDEQLFPQRLSNGKLVESNTFYVLDMGMNNGKKNIEIRSRGRNGINRNMVYFYENGMTGEGKATTSIDAKRIEMLKEDMVIMYNTRSCGIIRPDATV